ncbi:unnamed protein product [Tuber melanosporum]|uniref:(Perigord truffle) hypothetical protein n=1 Tax=Tuber melanosporum (strain Mel28) TaxID=656061 RepID=D5GIT0_TUBMM|nr:uncharacterized protein GSTUM_00008660001 [Tuber melanosporum]CAZ84423.1 unnamed protein product [Tuber melanosporum]
MVIDRHTGTQQLIGECSYFSVVQHNQSSPQATTLYTHHSNYLDNHTNPTAALINKTPNKTTIRFPSLPNAFSEQSYHITSHFTLHTYRSAHLEPLQPLSGRDIIPFWWITL